MKFRVDVAEDTSARADGMIRRGDGQQAQVLVAKRTDADTACADVDDDGAAGFTWVTTVFCDEQTGARVPVELTATRFDMDTTGTYDVVVQIGEERAEGTIRARVRLWPIPKSGR